MRHLKAGRKLGRNASHRLALMRNLTKALIKNERIITTVPKAKEARRFAEKLITLGKKGTLHARRLALARLPDRKIVSIIFDKIAPRFADRPGGYTRIIKRHKRRLGDAGETAILELLKAGEMKAPKPKHQPAPRVESEPKVQEQAEPSEERPAELQAEQQEPQAEQGNEAKEPSEPKENES
ncbi:MAG: 50S ribosomal protein L17 [Gemmatales bacterium]|nr:MAG: 50S ribosomal protein L17 [Gemmatales bacterium]